MEQALAWINWKDKANQTGIHRTRSAITQDRGKETQEEGGQTEDIQTESGVFRPDEIGSSIIEK